MGETHKKPIRRHAQEYWPEAKDFSLLHKHFKMWEQRLSPSKNTRFTLFLKAEHRSNLQANCTGAPNKQHSTSCAPLTSHPPNSKPLRIMCFIIFVTFKSKTHTHARFSTHTAIKICAPSLTGFSRCSCWYIPLLLAVLTFYLRWIVWAPPLLNLAIFFLPACELRTGPISMFKLWHGLVWWWEND